VRIGYGQKDKVDSQKTIEKEKPNKLTREEK
jgi:hypothetical protein